MTLGVSYHHFHFIDKGSEARRFETPRVPVEGVGGQPGRGRGDPAVRGVSRSRLQSASPIAKVSQLTQWKFSSYARLNTAMWKTNSLLYKDLARLNVLPCDEIQAGCGICAQKNSFNSPRR